MQFKFTPVLFFPALTVLFVLVFFAYYLLAERAPVGRVKRKDRTDPEPFSLTGLCH